MMRLNRILVEPIKQQEDLKECWCSRIFIDQTNLLCKKQCRIIVHPLIEKKQDPIYLSSQEIKICFPPILVSTSGFLSTKTLQIIDSQGYCQKGFNQTQTHYEKHIITTYVPQQDIISSNLGP